MTQTLLLTIVLAPLLGSIIAGLFGQQIGRNNAHRITILGVTVALALSAYVLKLVLVDGESYNATVYQWLQAAVSVLKLVFWSIR